MLANWDVEAELELTGGMPPGVAQFLLRLDARGRVAKV